MVTLEMEDHHRAVAAAISKPPSDWKRPPGRPNHVWLRAIESDLRLLDIGPFYAWKKVASREHWRSAVEAAIRSRRVYRQLRREVVEIGNESVPKIIINNTINLFFKLQSASW